MASESESARRASAITTDSIRKHYDSLSVLYRTFWGNHIHHGLWETARSAKAAQVALTERLAQKAGIRRGSRVLDIGCGLGGSSIWLAENLECNVLGLTISPVQVRIAERRAKRHGVGGRVEFRVEDANELRYENSFDCVWIIECSEHLFDKKGFIRRVAAALRPGGVLALCAWLASDDPLSDSARDLISRVCSGMLCPSLGSRRQYCDWIESAGMRLQSADDLTPVVSKTWDVSRKITQKPVIRTILKTADPGTLEFTDAFEYMSRAYAEGAMAYGMFTAIRD